MNRRVLLPLPYGAARGQNRPEHENMTKLEPFNRIDDAPVGPTLPTIHSNGTSAKTLLDGYMEAMNAVRAAREGIAAIEFNARDYYPVDGAWEKARDERRAMHLALEKIHADLLAIAIHCSDHVKD